MRLLSPSLNILTSYSVFKEPFSVEKGFLIFCQPFVNIFFLFFNFFGGGNRDRTCDLLNANQMLSQLSYAPKSDWKLRESAEIVKAIPKKCAAFSRLVFFLSKTVGLFRVLFGILGLEGLFFPFCRVD